MASETDSRIPQLPAQQEQTLFGLELADAPGEIATDPRKLRQIC